MIENILHKKIGGANLFSYFLVSALALAPSVSFADTTENNVVTASVSEGTVFESWLNGGACKFRVNNDNTVTLVGPTGDFYCSELTIPSSVSYSDENGSSYNFQVTRIADNAFAGKEIPKLYLPTSLEYIGENAFALVTPGLTPVKIMIGSRKDSGNPCRIGGNAFGYSPKIYVSANQVEAYQSAWSEYSSSIMKHPSGGTFSNGIFEYTYLGEDLSDALKLTKYVGQDKEVEIPQVLYDPNISNPTAASLGWVSDLGDGLFKNNTTIETVILGEFSSHNSIPNECFSGCTNLSKVILKGRYYNYYNSFEGCSKDLVIYVDESNWDFYHNDSSWKGLTIKSNPSYLKNVNDGNFYYSVSTDLKNAMLESISSQPKELVIPSSAKFTFEGKEHVVSVTSIGERFAERNTKTESVTIPASIENIASRVFARYTNLTTVIMLGSTPATIGDNVFNKNATIFVPAGTKEVYQKAWPEYSSNIKESIAGVIFDEGNFQFQGGEDQKLTLLSYHGWDEKEVTIPEEIVHNGSSYPVTCIAENAFNSCSLQRVNILGAKVQFSAKSFNNCSDLFDIIVPEAAYDDYMKNVDLSNQRYRLAFKGGPKVLTDDEDYPGDKVVVYDKGKLTYERTFQPGSQYATLCLPFFYLISETGFEEVYEPMHQIIHYTGNGDSKNNPKMILMLRKVSYELVSPGTPVFVKLGDSRKLSISNYQEATLGRGVDNILGNYMDVVDWDGKSGLMEMNTDFEIYYNGTYKHENAADIPGLYTFNGDGTFGPQTSGKLNPYRMYIAVKNSKLPAGAKYNISIGMNNGSTTGIQEIVTAPASKEAASSNAIYDLNGRLVSTTGSTQNLHKGVYIQNGKKLVVK